MSKNFIILIEENDSADKFQFALQHDNVDHTIEIINDGDEYIYEFTIDLVYRHHISFIIETRNIKTLDFISS
jgi:sRNA-binding regulator protein Hfq